MADAGFWVARCRVAASLGMRSIPFDSGDGDLPVLAVGLARVARWPFPRVCDCSLPGVGPGVFVAGSLDGVGWSVVSQSCGRILLGIGGGDQLVWPWPAWSWDTAPQFADGW